MLHQKNCPRSSRMDKRLQMSYVTHSKQGEDGNYTREQSTHALELFG